MRASEPFDELRPLLFSIAYRMVGSVSEAEDLVQDAFLRYHRTLQDGGAIESPRAFLSAVVTRLAMDHLRSARVRRESYVGPWLPEPLLTSDGTELEARHALADSLSMAFLVLLESLSPVERAVFLLREVFGYGYEEIAGIVDKSAENCRQLALRARRHLEEQRKPFTATNDEQEKLTRRFITACETGDLDQLVKLLADDVVAYTDGGGKVRAPPRPIRGCDAVARFLVAVTKRGNYAGPLAWREAELNQRPGRLVVDGSGQIIGTLQLGIRDGKVATLWVVSNPEKLGHLNRM